MWFIVFPTRPSPRKQAFAGMSAGFFTELRMGCVCARGRRPKELRRLGWGGGVSARSGAMGGCRDWLVRCVGWDGPGWCEKIFQGLGLDIWAAPKIVPTGSIVGSISGDLSNLPALHNAKLIVPACHDTASAIAAIPASGEDWGFISSGTWSL